MFTDLDGAIRDTVRFGDGSVVGIVGKGTIVAECKNSEQCKLAGVYLIPKLKANILSLGQLDECHTPVLKSTESKPPYVCPGCLITRIATI
jgi:hypothetical protein